MTPTKHVVVVGLGNIGSPLIELLARLGPIQRLTLIDRDRYETRNRSTQAISPMDTGKPKAVVQAERASHIQPGLEVEALSAAVEDVPLGRLRGDVILAGLDSKIARQHVNQIAWRLGVPWIDAGVRAEGLLARVNVYVPSQDSPCLECAWGDRDYETLDVPQPCRRESVATNAPAFLGSLAAALQTAACQELLNGNRAADGREVMVDVATHKLYETSYRRNPKCRFDHRTWAVEAIDGSLTVDEALHLTGGSLRVEGKAFSTKLRCVCGEQKQVFCLQGRFPEVECICPECGEVMNATGFDSVPWLTGPASAPHLTLAGIGLLPGDVIATANRSSLELTP